MRLKPDIGNLNPHRIGLGPENDWRSPLVLPSLDRQPSDYQVAKDDERAAVLEKLWFGDLTGDPAEQEAARSLAATVAEVQGLRPFSPAVQRLLTTIQDEYYTVIEVTEIIESDPSLAARVMRTVNSAAYGLKRECTSIRHAITLLGANAISQMAAAMAILQMFGGTEGPAATVSTHSARVGSLTRVIAGQCALPAADAVFTCGLLHDIGKLLLLQVSDSLPIGNEVDPYPLLLRGCEQAPNALHEREREIFGFDHAVLAGHVLNSWSIPDPVPEVIAWHHQPDRAYAADEQKATAVAAVRVADRLAYRLVGLEELSPELIDDLEQDPAFGLLQLSEEKLRRLWEPLRSACAETSLS